MWKTDALSLKSPTSAGCSCFLKSLFCVFFAAFKFPCFKMLRYLIFLKKEASGSFVSSPSSFFPFFVKKKLISVLYFSSCDKEGKPGFVREVSKNGIFVFLPSVISDKEEDSGCATLLLKVL